MPVIIKSSQVAQVNQISQLPHLRLFRSPIEPSQSNPVEADTSTSKPFRLNRDLSPRDRKRLSSLCDQASMRAPIGQSDLLHRPLSTVEIAGVGGLIGPKDIMVHDLVGMTSVCLRGGETDKYLRSLSNRS